MLTVDKPDIAAVIEGEGVELKKKGKNLWGICPFHEEKTPSFSVSPDKQAFYCFGCGVGGDVISFVEKYKGLDFKEAIKDLGIEGDRPYKPNLAEQEERESLEHFRQWEKEHLNYLLTVYRNLNRKKLKFKTMDEVENSAVLYHKESLWEHHLDILENGSTADKIDLWESELKKEKKGNEPYNRRT